MEMLSATIATENDGYTISATVQLAKFAPGASPRARQPDRSAGNSRGPCELWLANGIVAGLNNAALCMCFSRHQVPPLTYEA